LAGGHVVDPLAPRRGRRLPERLALLAAMAPINAASALQDMLARTGVVDLGHYALVRNLTPSELAALTDSPDAGFLTVGPQRAPVAITREHLANLANRVEAMLADWHRMQPDALGPSRAAIIVQFRAAAPEAAIDAALNELAAARRAVREGGMWRLPEHRPRLSTADEKLWQRVRPLLAEGELRPPRVREIAASLALEPEPTERLLRHAERLGRVAKIADNRFFLLETVERLAEIARELADESPEGAFTAAAFNDRSGVGRNLTIQILEYLDRIGATRRTGDTRVITERWVDNGTRHIDVAPN
jgi:selenocysteine-specific elongation factor